MPGPLIKQASAESIQSGATQPGYKNAVDMANKIAGALSSASQGQPQAGVVETVPDKSLLTYENQAGNNPHMLKMREAAEAAKQRYMMENGVDEDGNPISR
jgi:hypothetical protein